MAQTIRPDEIDLTKRDALDPPERAIAETAEVANTTMTNWIWGLTRITLGWIFLWPFLDKTFGLGYATASEDAWIDGGSPTLGFLKFGTKGPFAEFFQGFAGETWANWLFMIGLLCIGVALIAGVAVRIAAVSGAAMLTLMWLAVLPPEHNPIIDEHIIYAIVLLGLAAVSAGDYLGFGKWWKRLDLVQRFPMLR